MQGETVKCRPFSFDVNFWFRSYWIP